MTINKLTDEQVVRLRLRVMSAIEFHRQSNAPEADENAELLATCLVGLNELQERRKADSAESVADLVISRLDARDIEKAERRRIIQEQFNAASAERDRQFIEGFTRGWMGADKQPQDAPQNIPENIPAGWVMVPVEPTEDMIVNGFESEPDGVFSRPEVWEAYQAMSGCQQAAHRAKLCWAAMVAAAPHQGGK